MARYCPLFSGSNGNATYLGTAKGGVLVDAGVSAKRLKVALEERQIDPNALNALLITHEHTDHISGLRVFLKQYPMPVYATGGTLEALLDKNVIPDGVSVQAIEGEMTIGDLHIRPFATPHDSAESCGFCITFPDERTAAVATDMGVLTEEIRQALLGCDLVHIESNHDVRMLENGPYPYVLKCRILGNRGHLSNDRCAAFLPELLGSGTTRFVLTHLSRENNTPTLAQVTAKNALVSTGALENRDFLLEVAPPASQAPVMVF